MLSNSFLDQNIAAYHRRTLFPDRDPYAALAAQSLFEKTCRKARLGKIINWLLGRRAGCLQDLDEAKAQIRVTNSHYMGLREVPLSQICGSQGRACDYDAQFQPLDGRTKERWMSIATAWYEGRGLPPVELVKIGEHYFVQDGNHRVSVARAMGRHEIEAEVVEWQVAGQFPQEYENRKLVGEAAAAA